MKRQTLREARNSRGWTQKQLEEASGVEQAVISKLERGAVANPKFDTVCKLAEGLRIDPRNLVFGHQPESIAS